MTDKPAPQTPAIDVANPDLEREMRALDELEAAVAALAGEEHGCDR